MVGTEVAEGDTRADFLLEAGVDTTMVVACILLNFEDTMAGVIIGAITHIGIIHFIGEFRNWGGLTEPGPMRPMWGGPMWAGPMRLMWGGLTIHHEQRRHLQPIANQSNSSLTIGITVQIRRDTTHTLKVAREGG